MLEQFIVPRYNELSECEYLAVDFKSPENRNHFKIFVQGCKKQKSSVVLSSFFSKIKIYRYITQVDFYRVQIFRKDMQQEEKQNGCLH